MLLLILVLAAFVVLYLRKLNGKYMLLTFCKRFRTIDGSKLEEKAFVVPGTTIFGNSFDYIHLNPEFVFKKTRSNAQLSQGKPYILYAAGLSVYSITSAEDAKEVFQSTSIIRKSLLYQTIIPFLGEGLLISPDQKWHKRRRMLTPAFHFNVLQSFNEIFKEESLKAVKRLEGLQQDKIDLGNIITEFTLNNVCETAMGVNLDNVSGSDEYRKSIHDIELILVERIHNPLLIYNGIFRWFGKYHQHMRDLKKAHNFTSFIIEKRRAEFQLQNDGNSNIEEVDLIGKKKRYAMLDTLLLEEANGEIDHQGICDEVNTFMFEGFDTTSSCLIMTLLNLAWFPDIQNKCRKEAESLGDFRSLSIFDFNRLEYLECVLKESLRLYPSVPFIGRTVVKETELNGIVLPSNSEVHIHIFDIHRDPKHFPDPLAFKPERFAPENCVNMHPFAFVPFSAGSRNCIGQKFAILEMKALIVSILRNFRILPITQLEEIDFETGMVLRTKQSVYVKLEKL